MGVSGVCMAGLPGCGVGAHEADNSSSNSNNNNKNSSNNDNDNNSNNSDNDDTSPVVEEQVGGHVDAGQWTPNGGEGGSRGAGS